MIELTDSIRAVEEFINPEVTAGSGPHIAVVDGGSSGFQDDLAPADSATGNDETQTFGDVHVYVD